MKALPDFRFAGDLEGTGERRTWLVSGRVMGAHSLTRPMAPTHTGTLPPWALSPILSRLEFGGRDIKCSDGLMELSLDLGSGLTQQGPGRASTWVLAGERLRGVKN